jgi:hypothetical protein
LDRLVELRNYLAHDYLTDNFSLFKNDEARSMLITELKYYAEEFNEFEEEFSPLIDIIIEELKSRVYGREMKILKLISTNWKL